MTQSNDQKRENTDTVAAAPRARKFQALSVIASVVLPIAAAYVVFYTGVGMPDSTVNQGELLQPPRSIEPLHLAEEGTAPFQLGSEEPKWRYLIVPGQDCAEKCEQLLYTSRQVHVRLGEKARRVERLLVNSAPLSPERRAQLAEQHPRLRFVTVPEPELRQLLEGTSHSGLDYPSALLVDQRGFAMMVYNNEHSGNQLLKDIKRLLKYSYEQ
ncbi:hypothetical protein [Microbulbifer yueqingensis]|uniref:Cytochrome oxidase Cu insertion factor, SCO1/SenC/PrrC family n=1 Tax=Microbulbifer yueqingensis TaxID=658219 RepID=A0A1G9BXR0_9GAMM|nr:hypothetical protein [Microbulbifer yueqingensis]SDK44239.1 Cytochrome oxidase Cu insertion factor, SCO1/SenC/PrrC family [Microbulbifer yueqingensis]